MKNLAGYRYLMTGRTISIIAVLIVIIIGGGLLYWQFGTNTTTPATTENTPNTASTTPDQVAGQDVTVGTGKEATPGSIVTVLYVGMLQDGTVFDSSEKNGGQPLVFALGTDGLIPGFQIGVNGMKEGGERRIAVPPEFAYGDQEVKDPEGKVVIPANSTIVFDLKLVKVEAASTTPQQ